METIRAKYEADAEACKAALVERCLELNALCQPVDPAALLAKFSGEPSTTSNAVVVDLLTRTQKELFMASSHYATIQAWLQLSVPMIEDGNNFGVGILLEGLKMVTDAKKEITDLMKDIPDYYKERAAAVEKVNASTSTSTTETQSQGNDKTTKAEGAAEASEKASTNRVVETKNVTPTPSPDAVAHVAAIDVAWYLRLYGACDRARGLYASVADFLEKNHDKISAPKGSGGGGLSMF